MTQPSNLVRFTEGSIHLPAGYEDRTANLFVPANTTTQPNLNVARDWMKPGETLATYIDRQIALMKGQLAGHRVIQRGPIEAGAAVDAAGAEATSALIGEAIEASYKNGKLLIYQRQAAFEVAPLRVLIFTASKAGGFNEAFETLWREWLASYQPPAATTTTTTAPDAPSEG